MVGRFVSMLWMLVWNTKLYFMTLCWSAPPPSLPPPRPFSQLFLRGGGSIIDTPASLVDITLLSCYIFCTWITISLHPSICICIPRCTWIVDTPLLTQCLDTNLPLHPEPGYLAPATPYTWILLSCCTHYLGTSPLDIMYVDTPLLIHPVPRSPLLIHPCILIPSP